MVPLQDDVLQFLGSCEFAALLACTINLLGVHAIQAACIEAYRLQQVSVANALRFWVPLELMGEICPYSWT